MSGGDLNSTTALAFEVENASAASTETPDKLHSHGVLVFAACVWILVTVLGITGNTMVILSAILSKHVRTMTNVLVINLSVADLWTSLSLPWTSVALLSDGNWPLATEVPCQVAAFMWHTGLGASLYNLALIALNRLIRITRPVSTYNWIFTPCKMAGIVVLSWLIPVFVIVFPLAIGAGGLGHDLKHDTCTDEDVHPRANEYNLAQTIGFYPIPMATVIISYLVIYIHVKKHFRKQLPKTKNTNNSSTGPTESDATTERERKERKQKVSRQQLQITKNLFWVFCAFVLCISPYFISLFFPTSEKFALYGATILICNSCINPFIYGARHPQFKKVMRPMLMCRWEKIPQPSRILQAIIAKREKEDKVGAYRSFARGAESTLEVDEHQEQSCV